MKKVLLVIGIFALMNCEVKVREASAAPNSDFIKRVYYLNNGSPDLAFRRHWVDNMEYGIFHIEDGTSQTGFGVAVVNLTKDKLEVEKLKLEIAKLKK